MRRCASSSSSSSSSVLLMFAAGAFLSSWTHASQANDLEWILAKFSEIYLSETIADTTATKTAAETATYTAPGPATRLRLSVREKAGRRRDERSTPRATTADVARSERPDGTPCPSVEGHWLSVNLDTVFEVSASAQAGRLDLRADGSDWTGTVESLLGEGGPVSAYIGQPTGGSAATFVGHCRVVDGVDSIAGTRRAQTNTVPGNGSALFTRALVVAIAALSSGIRMET